MLGCITKKTVMQFYIFSLAKNIMHLMCRCNTCKHGWGLIIKFIKLNGMLCQVNSPIYHEVWWCNKNKIANLYSSDARTSECLEPYYSMISFKATVSALTISSPMSCFMTVTTVMWDILIVSCLGRDHCEWPRILSWVISIVEAGSDLWPQQSSNAPFLAQHQQWHLLMNLQQTKDQTAFEPCVVAPVLICYYSWSSSHLFGWLTTQCVLWSAGSVCGVLLPSGEWWKEFSSETN